MVPVDILATVRHCRIWHKKATRFQNLEFRAEFVTHLVKSQYRAEAIANPTKGHAVGTQIHVPHDHGV